MSPGPIAVVFIDNRVHSAQSHRDVNLAETAGCCSHREAPTLVVISATDPTGLCHASNHAKVTSFAYVLRKAPVSG